MQTVQLTSDEFDARFQPIPHPRHGGFYYVTPDDTDLITQAGLERRLFTAVDGDNGETLLISGWHLVNRFAYVIVAHPWEPDVEYVVNLNEDSDFCPECDTLLNEDNTCWFCEECAEEEEADHA